MVYYLLYNNKKIWVGVECSKKQTQNLQFMHMAQKLVPSPDGRCFHAAWAVSKSAH